MSFPPAVADLPREYLLNVPRPALIGDFFEERFAITLIAEGSPFHHSATYPIEGCLQRALTWY